MSDLISRDAAFKMFEDEPWADDNERDYAEDLLLNVPAVDAVPVVHCGECKKRNTKLCPMAEWCLPHHGENYCSYGERKDGEK